MKVQRLERPGDGLFTYQFALGSMRYATDEMIPTLEEMGRSALVDRARSTVGKVEEAIQLRYDWQQHNRRDPLARKGAKELDGRIDRTISSLMNGAKAYTILEGDTEERELAEEFIEQLFSGGVAPITHSTYTEQHADVDALLDRLRNDYATHVQKLNLEMHVDQLEELNEEFGRRLSPQEETIAYDEVEAAYVEAEDAFHRLLLEIMAEFSEDLATANRVLAPVFEQSERTRRHLQRRGSVPEVDPETGEPVENTDSGPGVSTTATTDSSSRAARLGGRLFRVVHSGLRVSPSTTRDSSSRRRRERSGYEK